MIKPILWSDFGAGGPKCRLTLSQRGVDRTSRSRVFRRDIGQSSSRNKITLHFSYLAPFRNDGGSKACRYKSSPDFALLTPVKVRGGMGRRLDTFQQRPNLWYSFGGRSLCCLVGHRYG